MAFTLLQNWWAVPSYSVKAPASSGSNSNNTDVLLCPRPLPSPLSQLYPSASPCRAGTGITSLSRATGATFVCLSGCFPFWANAQFNCTSYCVIPVQSCSKIPTSTPFPFRSLQSPFCLISTVISRAELRFLPFRPQALSDAVAAEINPHPEQSRNDLLQVEVVLFPSRLIYQPPLQPPRSAAGPECWGESGTRGLGCLAGSKLSTEASGAIPQAGGLSQKCAEEVGVSGSGYTGEVAETSSTLLKY